MLALRSYSRLPSIQNGYELDDQFSVVVPVARTNLVQNPSFETNTTSWTAIGGSIARSTAQQYHGAYSLAITPTAATTDGVRYDTVSLTAGTAYAYSAKVLGIGGKSYKLAIETTAGVELTSVTFVATGRWQWVYGYYYELTTATRRLTLRKAGGTELLVFYLDGTQVEAIASGETVSTYLDGDQQGFVPNQSPAAYYWNGTPHASTSARSGLTRAGGMVVNFRNFGFFLTAIVGLGLANPFNAATEYARIDGGYDDYTRKPTRQFTLSGQFQGQDYLTLRQNRGGLARLLDRDLVGQDQRLLLRREVIDQCGVAQTSTCQVIGKYQGGLSGNTDNQSAEQAALTFTQYLPTIRADGESGASLGVQQSLVNADYFIKRNPAGVWSVPGGGTAAVSVLFEGSDGTIYIGGSFANWNGIAAADGIVKYNPTTGVYTACSTGVSGGGVFAMAQLPDGKIVMGGGFTLAGGVANTVRIAVYNPVTDAFTALGTGASTNNVLSLAVDSTGGIYAGGDYGLMGGVANTVRLAYWNGSAWTALGTGANGTVYAIAVGRDGYVYLTGGFTTLNGVACNQIGRYLVSTATFSAMSTGVNGSGGRALAIGPNNLLYIGGLFTAAGGISGTNRIASWNGVAFQSMGGGIGNDVNQLSVGANGAVLAIGSFGQSTTPSGAFMPDGAAQFNGSAWTTIGIDVPASNIINAGIIARDGTLYLAYGVTGTAITEAVTVITNPGTARSYPTIVINGPSSGTSRVYSIINYTTNRAIYLNLTLNVGETATLIFTPDNLSFTSTAQGNIAGMILPGSNTADFFLNPGANSLAVFVASSTVTAALSFRPAYLSLDDVP